MLLSNTGWPRADNVIISRWAAARAASSFSTVKENIHRMCDINLRGLEVCLPSLWNSAVKAWGAAGLCRCCIATKPGPSLRHWKQHRLRHFEYVTLRLFLPLFSSPVKNYLFWMAKAEFHNQQADIHIFKKRLTFPNSGSLYHHKLFPWVFKKMPQVSLSLGMQKPLESSLTEVDEGALPHKSTTNPLQMPLWVMLACTSWPS